VESELLGHVQGAFTGAREARLGVFRAAHGGTVFLDEIGAMPPSIQPKFLRALQEKAVRPVGGLDPEPFDARVVAATNRDLRKDAGTGEFRRDLFYRLHVIPIHVPPLRERPEDIPPLVETFLDRHSGPKDEPIQIRPEAMAALSDYHWPGNVRELENCVEQLCILRKGSTITLDDLPPMTRTKTPPAGTGGESGRPHIKPLAAREKEAVGEALRKTGGNKTAAAKALGISVPTLYAKIRKYNIQINDAD
jgi:transcriptional regulator with PAS, ATPase and Fis domain